MESAGAITAQFESDDYAAPVPERDLGLAGINIRAVRAAEELLRHRAA